MYNELTMKRIALIAGAAALLLLIAGTLALWLFLSSWVPGKGKARLIEELERSQVFDVEIGAMRYELLRGLIVDRVTVTRHEGAGPVARIRQLRGQVGWLGLALRRVAVFRARATVEAPCPADAVFSGRYNLNAKTLVLDADTTPVDVTAIGLPLSRFLPKPLTGGRVELRAHIEQQPDAPLLIDGRLTGSGLVWTAPSWTATGALVVDGRATPPPAPGTRWAIDAKVALRDGTVEGLKTVGPVTHLEGTGALTSAALLVHELNGVALGSPWTVEGTIGTGPLPALEILITSRAQLKPLAEAMPFIARAGWQSEGAADLRAVCRGPLRPAARLDCLVQAGLRDGTISSAKLSQPVTGVTGALAYDLVMRRLSSDGLNARIANEAITVSGEALLTTPPAFALQLKGALPLEAAAGLLPATAPVTGLSGRAAVELSLTGTLARLRPVGRVEFQGAGATLRSWPKPIEDLNGVMVLDGQRIEIRQAAFQVDGQPVGLDAVVTELGRPRVVGTVTLPRGTLQLAGQLDDRAFVLDEARLAMAQSRLKLTGSIARAPERPSRLTLSGIAELSELTQLPFVELPGLESWKLRGAAAVEAQFSGPIAGWRRGLLQGRLQADHLAVRDVPLDQVTVEFEQNEQGLYVRMPAGLVANGSLKADLAIEPRPEPAGSYFLLEADLTHLELERLGEAIPAWRTQQISGTASGHATMSGTWQMKESWRGEGWLNASGERLGNLPLLNRLFRGIFGLLAERLGLESLRRAQITQVATEWQLAEARFRTENLRLGGFAGSEPVAVYARGSVGLDHTLDFVVEPELSEGVLLQAPATASIAGTVLKAAGQLERLRRLIGRHRVLGTLKEPQYRFELTTQEVFRQLVPGPADLIQNLLDVVR